MSVMNKMVDLLMLLNTMGGKESGRGTTSIVKMVKAVFAEASSMESAGSKMAKYYRLFVAPSQKNPVNNYTFNLWCFHPGFSMKSLLNCGIRSLILTSGTLKPLSALSRELDINFQINFCGDHVVKREQGGSSTALKTACEYMLTNGIFLRAKISNIRYIDT